MDQLVITLIAADHPGLVERVAQCIAGHGGNWLDSRMARMAGQFAGILRIAVEPSAHDDLVRSLQDLERHGIRVQFAGGGQASASPGRAVELDLVGNDRPGIVREITRSLAEQGINLERLQTDVRPAPMSGEPLFHAQATLAVPASASLETLQARLESLADELMVELRLDHEPGS